MLNGMKNLVNEGVHIFEERLDLEQIQNVYNKILASRDFGPNLFLSEAEYLEQENHLKANPTREYNFLNQFDSDLAFIEEDKSVSSLLHEALGQDYDVVLRKLVCGVPESWLPDWVKPKIEGINVANLGAYIKHEYRDVTYFRGIDFHQDIIDWPQGSTDLDPSTFLTLYVYIHDVDKYDSPLHILPGSHKLGATLFPHNLKNKEGKDWEYRSDSGDTMTCQDIELVGKSGYVGIWHNCTLHGTQPVKNESEKFRISIRYLMGKSNENSEHTGIDDINEEITGELRPIRTRQDLDQNGKATMKGNIINRAK